MDGTQAVASALLVVGIILIVESVVLFLRAWAKGNVRDSLAYMVLLPTRRNRALASFTAMVGGFLGATIVRLSTILGVFPTVEGQAITATCIAIASISMSILVFVGLDPRPLNETERLFIDQPSHIVYSMGVVDRRESGVTDTGGSN